MDNKNRIFESFIQLLDSSLDLVMIVDITNIKNDMKEYKIVYANEQMGKSFKTEAKKLIGKNLWTLLPRDVANARKKQALQIIKSKKSYIFEDERNGRYFKSHYIPIFDENHEVRYIGTINREITSIKLVEKKYQQLLNNMNEGFFTLDETGRFTFVNKIMEIRSGFSKDEFYKNTFSNIVLPEYKEILKKQFNFLLNGKQVKPIEIGYYNSKEEKIYLEINAHPIYKKDRIIGIQGTTRDITEIERNLKKLHESKERWCSLVKNIPKEDRITIIDKDYKILYVNRVTAGRTKHDVIGRNAIDFTAPESRSIVKKKLQKVFNSGEPVKYESKTITPKGNINTYDITVAPIKEKDFVSAAIIFARNITNLKKAELDRILIDGKYRLLLENSGCPITYIDTDGVVQMINYLGAKNLHGTPDDLIGKSIYEIIPDIAEKNKRRFLKIIESGKGNIFEDEIKLSTGNRWFLSYLQPVKEYDNIIVGIQIVSIDITKQKQIENKIKETKEYLNKVIENSNEIIFTINKDRKISLWNHSAEKISGIKFHNLEKKSFSEIDFIENHKDIADYIEHTFSNKKIKLDQIIIRNHSGSTRILKPSVSVMYDDDDNISDIIFICNDVTYNIELHEQVLPGSSYFIDASNNTALKQLLSGFIYESKNGLFITREPIEIASQYIDSPYLHIQIFSTLQDTKYQSLDSPDEMKKSILNFIKNKKNPVVFIDRIDYLMNIYDFHDIYPVLCEINDAIRKHNAMIFIRINRDLLSEKEYFLIKEECDTLPSKHLEHIYLDGSLFEILEFIFQEDNWNRVVNQDKILKRFTISKVTAQKRITALLDDALIISKHEGRSKHLYITKKGKELVEKKEKTKSI